MLTKQEMINIPLLSLILGFSLSLITNLETFTLMFFSMILIIFVNILGKKLIAFYYDTQIEHKLWEVKRYGWNAGSKLKKAIPMGVILPIITTILSSGVFVWMNGLYFQSKPEIYQVAKRRKYDAYLEHDEGTDGIIAAFGVVSNLLLAGIMLLIGAPIVAKLSIYYAFFNILPIGKLDGNKIFYGSNPGHPEKWFLYKAVIVVTLIATGFAYAAL